MEALRIADLVGVFAWVALGVALSWLGVGSTARVGVALMAFAHLMGLGYALAIEYLAAGSVPMSTDAQIAVTLGVIAATLAVVAYGVGAFLLMGAIIRGVAS